MLLKTIAHEVAYWTSCLVIVAALAVSRTVVYLLPVSFLKKVFTAQMAKLGVLVTNGPKAIGFMDKNKYTAEMVVHSDAFYKHLGDGPLLHVLGDTYMVSESRCCCCCSTVLLLLLCYAFQVKADLLRMLQRLFFCLCMYVCH